MFNNPYLNKLFLILGFQFLDSLQTQHFTLKIFVFKIFKHLQLRTTKYLNKMKHKLSHSMFQYLWSVSLFQGLSCFCLILSFLSHLLYLFYHHSFFCPSLPFSLTHSSQCILQNSHPKTLSDINTNQFTKIFTSYMQVSVLTEKRKQKNFGLILLLTVF